jgi:putative tryptophan/tyrosine transport system substrate-binding protein
MATDIGRRQFISAVGGAAVAWPLAARAQQQSIPVIGFLGSVAPGRYVTETAAVRQGLAEAGYVEGQNLMIEYRWAENQPARLATLAAELVRSQVSVLIAAGGTAPALAARAATTSIPVVFVLGGDPVKLGLVASVNRPGGNLTGVTFSTVTLGSKRLELLHQMLPRAKVIAVLVNPENLTVEDQSRELQDGASALGLQITFLTANSDLEAAFAKLLQLRAEAVLVTADAVFTNRRDQIVALAARHGIPAIYPRQEYVEAGGLVSYGPRVADSYRQAGVYTARILKGEKPSELPVMQPTKFELFINLKTAKALGIDIPPTFLALADEVIE